MDKEKCPQCGSDRLDSYMCPNKHEMLVCQECFENGRLHIVLENHGPNVAFCPYCPEDE
jgi:hypothetical protein